MIPQNNRIFRLFTDVSRVSGVHTEKINIPATKGVVFVSGEPWVGSPCPPNVNYTRERIYRETEKEQQRGCLYFRCTANHFPSAPTGISRFGFLFLLFACPKKDFAKDIFLIRLAKSRECRPSFRKKSLIIFSSKREKSVEYRVRGTFPEKKFPPTGCKT